MFPLSFGELSCGWPRPGRSTGLFGRPTESDCVLSRSWDRSLAPPRPAAATPHSNGSHGSNGSNNGHPRLRDQLCLLIRQYELDPVRVKRYAADFCGTEVLRDAGRDLVESFVTMLADQAAKDREGLICKLNSYGSTEAVNS